MKQITSPGIYFGMSSDDYFADPCPEPSLSRSICKVLLERSALRARHEHPRLAPLAEDDEAEKYVKAKVIGDAAHAIMIGRGKTLEAIKFNDFKKGEARDLRDEALASGKTPILEKHLVIASDIVAAGLEKLKRHKDDSDAFTNGDGEVALVWQDDGIWCRALVDWLHTDLLTVDDYKTSGMSMAPHILGLRAESAGWHIQAAFIERGLDALHPAGAGRRRFRFIVQEQDGRPYDLITMRMTEYWMTMGRKKVDAAVARWRAAVTSGRWQGYPLEAQRPEYPSYRERQWLERELTGEFETENDKTLIMAG